MTQPQQASSRWPLIIGTVVLASVLVVAVVVLALAGLDPAAIGTVVGVAVTAFTALAALIVPLFRETTRQGAVLDQQTHQLAVITENTNGHLDARIRRAVAQVFDARVSADPRAAERARIAAVEAQSLLPVMEDGASTVESDTSTEDSPQ